jgi:hypothetical protein
MKKLLGCLGIGFGLLVVIGIIGAVIGIDSDRGEGDPVESEEAVSTDRGEASPAKKKAESKPETVVDAAEIQGKRNAVIGKTFATLTVGEKQFSNATVESIDAIGIRLKHDSGLASLKWDEVPEQVRVQWGYDPAAFKAAIAAQERAKAAADKRQQEMAAAAKKRQEKEEREKMGDHIGAYVYMQMFVKERLKSPKSADFPVPASQFCRPLGDYRYRVDAYVDATNSFGGEIRTKFSGIIKQNVGDDSWTLESLDIFE